MNRTRTGFSTVEVAISASLVAILGTLVLTSMGKVSESQKRAVTTRLMQDLGTGLTTYLETNKSLGDAADASDFQNDPWAYLHKNRSSAGHTPYLNLPVNNLGKYTSGESVASVSSHDDSKVSQTNPGMAMAMANTMSEATHIVDAFDRSPLQWSIVNGSVGDRHYTYAVEIRSHAGTPDDPSDDIVMHYNTTGAELRLGNLTIPDTRGGFVFQDSTDTETPEGPIVVDLDEPETPEAIEPEPEEEATPEPPEDDGLFDVSGTMNLNPANSSNNEFVMTTSSGSTTIRDRDHLEQKGSTFSYNGPASKVAVRPKANTGTISINGQTVKLDNKLYTFTGELTVSLVNNKAGKNNKAANGHWWITLSGSDIDISPTPPGF